MSEEKVIFYVRNHKRAGILNRCNESNSCVIFAHGLGGNKNNFKKLPEIFCQHGISTFRFDFIGHGESEGNISDMSVFREVEDLNAAVDFVKNEGYEKIGVIGHSLGGMVSVLTQNKDVSCITLLNPVIFGRETFLKLFDMGKFRELERKGYVTYSTEGNKKIQLGIKFFEEVMKIDILSKIKEVEVPILFILSSEDEIINPKYSELAFKETNEPKKLEIIKGASHSFDYSRHEIHALETAALWFKKWFG